MQKKTTLEENVLPEDHLELSNGNTVKSALELIDCLSEMNEEIFRQNVSKTNNQIADWILEGYGKEKLAKNLRKTNSKKKIINLIQREIKREQREIKKSSKIKKIKTPKLKSKIIKELKK